MNKKIVILLLIVVTAAGLFILFNKGRDETTQPNIKSITEAVYASGYIVPEDEYKIYAMAEGYIVSKNKSAGDTVKPGEVILTVQNEASAAKVGASLSALEYARLNASDNSPVMTDLMNKLNSAEAKYKNDSINYHRYKAMYEAQAITKTQFDQASLTYEIAGNDLKSAREMLTKTREQLKVELRNAQSGLAASNQESGNYVIRSLMDGIVYDLTKELGEAVRRNDVLGIVGTKGEKKLQLSVDQNDISKIKTGQAVVVKMDVTGDKTYNAAITKIYPNMNQNDQSFKVEATFTEPYHFEFVHASVEANIIIAQKEKALVIPKNVVQPGDIVEVKALGMNKQVKIKKGLENLEFIEVLEGVSDSDEIVIPKAK